MYDFIKVVSGFLTDCPSETVQYADLIFVMDSSDSITSLWETMKEFIINVIQRIDIGPENVRVGLVLFADDAQVEISLGEIGNKNRLISDIRAVRPISGATNLRAAMEVTAEQFEKIGADRSGANDIVIILTDASATTENDATRTSIDRLKQTGEGVHIIPVAVSDDVKVDWLELLVNNPGIPASTPIRAGVDYFLDDQLRQAQSTIQQLFDQKLRELLNPICDILGISSKCGASPFPPWD